MTDALGNVTTMGYDVKGNLISVIDPMGNTKSIAYNTKGMPVAMTDARAGLEKLDSSISGNAALQ